MVVEHVRPILLVEDETDDVAFVMRALERANVGNPVVVATTPAEARDVLAGLGPRGQPVLAVVDVYLPGRDNGLDFLTWLRRQPGELARMPAMIYSVSDRPQHQADAAELGGIVMLRKPVTEETLANAVQALGFVTTTAGSDGVTRFIEPH